MANTTVSIRERIKTDDGRWAWSQKIPTPTGKLKPAEAERRGKFHLVWTEKEKKRKRTSRAKRSIPPSRPPVRRNGIRKITLTASVVLILFSRMNARQSPTQSNATCNGWKFLRTRKRSKLTGNRCANFNDGPLSPIWTRSTTIMCWHFDSMLSPRATPDSPLIGKRCA